MTVSKTITKMIYDCNLHNCFWWATIIYHHYKYEKFEKFEKLLLFKDNYHAMTDELKKNSMFLIILRTKMSL